MQKKLRLRTLEFYFKKTRKTNNVPQTFLFVFLSVFIQLFDLRKSLLSSMNSWKFYLYLIMPSSGHSDLLPFNKAGRECINKAFTLHQQSNRSKMSGCGPVCIGPPHVTPFGKVFLFGALKALITPNRPCPRQHINQWPIKDMVHLRHIW